jgi:hypothetical protein
MDINSILEKLDQYSIQQIKDIQFKFENNIYFTYESKPEFHDAVLKACELQLNKRMH